MTAAPVKIGELFAQRLPSVNPARYQDETFELYSIPAFDRGAPDVVAGRDIGSAKQVVKPGDVLLSKIVPHIRRAWVVGKDSGRRILASGEWIVFNSERIDPRYLQFALISDEFHHEYMTTVGGVGGSLLRAQRDQVGEIQVPLPSLHEQGSIADALDAVRNATELESSAISRAMLLKAEVMRELFSRGLRGELQRETEVGPIPESWQSATVGDHFAVVSGGTPSRANPNYWRGGTIPWVKTAEIKYGVICSTEECITELGFQNSAAKMLAPGTILMAMYGQGITRGKVAILGIEASCNQACAAMTPLGETIEPMYLFHFLAYRYADVRRLAHGGQQQNLNLDIVRDLPIVFSNDRGEQEEIVVILDAIDRKINLHEQKKLVLDVLFKALLNGLMTGQIHVSDLQLTALGARENRAEAAAV